MPLCDGLLYKVREGDTIVSIARKYNVKLARLISANPQLANPVDLEAGEEICIPEVKGNNQAIDNKKGTYTMKVYFGHRQPVLEWLDKTE